MSGALSSQHIEGHVQGEISGQVAIGSYILQIGSVHGGLVNVAAPNQGPQFRPRPTPVYLRPRPFPDILDRQAEVQAATAALASAMQAPPTQASPMPVAFHGQAGIGKTSLLRHLAYHAAAGALPGGVVYLAARYQFAEDLLQALFDAFYEGTAPGPGISTAKPTETQVRHALLDKRALILLDDVDLPREQVEMVIDAAPRCAFVLASVERRLWGTGQAMPLSGLPDEEALALVERELGHSLAPQEHPQAQALCAALDGHPLHILQAAAMAREEGRSLAEIARQVSQLTPIEALAAQVLTSLPEVEKRVLAVLAALGDISLHADHIASLARLPDALPVLQDLQRRSLVQACSPRYSLAGAVGQALRQTWDLTPLAERMLVYLTTWAEGMRGAPNQLLQEAEALLQVLQWAVKAARWAEALRLARAIEGALALGRRWDAWAQVLQWALGAARALEDQATEAWALHQLGTRALCVGDKATARSSLIQALRMRESLGDHVGAAVTRHNLEILLGPPAPPRPARPTPRTAPAGPVAAGTGLSFKVIALLLPLLILAAGIWATFSVWSRPTPTPLPTATATAIAAMDTVTPGATPALPTATPYTTTPTGTPTGTPPPTHTPTVTPTPTVTHTPTPTATPDRVGPPAPRLSDPASGTVVLCASGEEGRWVQLKWEGVSDPSGIQYYEASLAAIERSPYVYPSQFFTGVSANLFLPCGDTYRWQVRARDGAGNPGAWSAERTFSLRDTTPPPAPALIEPADGVVVACPGQAGMDITLRWSPVTDITGIARYEVELVKTPDYPPVPVTVTLQIEGSRTQASIHSACAERTRWRVRAVDGVGNVGAWSVARSLRVQPALPDLWATLQATGPARIAPDGQVVVPLRVVVQNGGTAGAGVFAVSVEYYTTTVGTPPSILLSRISGLAAGSQATLEQDVTLPSTLQGQSISLRAWADSLNSIPESDEDNNRSAPISVSAPSLIAVELVATADVYVDSLNASQNYSTTYGLLVGTFYSEGERWYRSLIRFTLSPTIPAGVQIQEATLSLYLLGGRQTITSEVGIARVLGAWQEAEVNWENQPPTSWPELWASIPITDPLEDTYSCDVTYLVQDWVMGQDNHGLALMEDPKALGTVYTFASRESDNPPRLRIWYIKMP